MWRQDAMPGVLSSNFVSVLLVTSCILSLTLAQYFEPGVKDKDYLDNLQRRIEVEVNVTRDELYAQAKIIEDITKQFVAAQLKENLFIALRVLAEKELEQLREEQNRITQKGASKPRRQSRQDDDDDDSDTTSATGAGGSTGRPVDNVPFQMGLIPQVANLVKAIFGGNSNINLTNYVSSASRLLPKPVGNQVVGLVGLLAKPDPPTPKPKAPYQVSRTRTPSPQLAGDSEVPELPEEQKLVQAAVAPQRIRKPISNVSGQPSQPRPALNRTSVQTAQQAEQAEISNIQDLFDSVNQIKPVPVAVPTNQNQKRPGDKTYIYNTGGSKGVAGSAATVRPLIEQEYIPVSQNQQTISQPQSQYQVQLKPPRRQYQQQQQLQGPVFPSQSQFQQTQGNFQQIQGNFQQPQGNFQQNQANFQPNQFQPNQANQFQQNPGAFPPNQAQFQQQFPQQLPQQPLQQQQQRPAFPPVQATTLNPDEDEDEDEDEDGRKRQFNLGSLLPSLLGNFLPTTTTTPRPRPVYNPPAVQQTVPAVAPGTAPVGNVPQTQAVQSQMVQGLQNLNQPGVVPSTITPGAAMMAQGFNLRMFAMDVGKNLGDIFRVMPDIFRGAREGVQLLQTLSSVFGGLEALGGLADIGGIL